MRLSNRDNTSFELSVVNYQFPEEKKCEWDSNWLIVEIKVVHPLGNWKSIDACLLNFELTELANWLRKIARHESVHELSFMEPNLEFRPLDNGKTIRIVFDLESKPKWADEKIPEGEGIYLDISFNDNDLIAAADDLDRQIAKYPVRAR